MIDYNEEVAKFQPSLEIDQAEEAIFNNEMTDISDLIDTVLRGAAAKTQTDRGNE